MKNTTNTPNTTASQQGQIFDVEQVIFALERARDDLQAQADRRHENHDYSAEFPAEDAARLSEAITLLRARPVEAPDTDNTSKAQYRRMFQAACEALGEIGDALGCDPDTGGAQHILTAIARKEAQAGKTVDDLAALVRRLAHALRKATPGHELPGRALDYLKRKGLQGTPLRSQLGREGKMKKATMAVKTRDGGAIEIAGWQLACGAVVHRTPHSGVKWRVFYDDAWSVSDTVTGGAFAHGNSMADAVGRYRALVRQHGPDFETELQARRGVFLSQWDKR